MSTGRHDPCPPSARQGRPRRRRSSPGPLINAAIRSFCRFVSARQPTRVLRRWRNCVWRVDPDAARSQSSCCLSLGYCVEALRAGFDGAGRVGKIAPQNCPGKSPAASAVKAHPRVRQVTPEAIAARPQSSVAVTQLELRIAPTTRRGGSSHKSLRYRVSQPTIGGSPFRH